MGKQRLTPAEKQAKREGDRRGCGDSYRAGRRNEARRQNLSWRALRRTVLATGSVVVML
jgi:hypothetical protein